jgi:hypothetical protein
VPAMRGWLMGLLHAACCQVCLAVLHEYLLWQASSKEVPDVLFVGLLQLDAEWLQLQMQWFDRCVCVTGGCSKIALGRWPDRNECRLDTLCDRPPTQVGSGND